MNDHPGPRMNNPIQNQTIWSRRSFLSFAGWLTIGTTLMLWALSFLRFMFPRVLFEPLTIFTAGPPADYTDGEVSTKYKEDHRVWIIRDDEGFYVLRAVCTHLGCTPNWMPLENKFKCPCHGSGYTKKGINFEGPAPRPLERVHVALDDQFRIVVDTSIRYRQERGEWSKPGAFLFDSQIRATPSSHTA